ncbi:MAG: PilZ domain-containing protein [Thermodesulfobacteriota bacterium]|nr:PilZ domain-containing protein [Thermodesulfobacteriota bacterium]
MGKERRRHTRVDFLTHIVLKSKGSEIAAQGSSRDLSCKGIFINTREKLAENDGVEVKIILSGGGQNIELFMDAFVARVEAHGLGLEFTRMDLDTYTYLKNIVMYNKDEDI